MHPPRCLDDVRLESDPSTGSAVIDFPTAGAIRLSETGFQSAFLVDGYAVAAPPGTQ